MAAIQAWTWATWLVTSQVGELSKPGSCIGEDLVPKLTILTNEADIEVEIGDIDTEWMKVQVNS